MSAATPLSLADMEQAARRALDEATWAYLAGGAGCCSTYTLGCC